jgi:hypothetical protein
MHERRLRIGFGMWLAAGERTPCQGGETKWSIPKALERYMTAQRRTRATMQLRAHMIHAALLERSSDLCDQHHRDGLPAKT